jgi:hypothetical protein
MEVHSANFSSVAREGLERGMDALSEPTLRNASDAHVAIFRARGDEMLIEGVEVEVEHSRLVNGHEWNARELSRLGLVKDSINTATTGGLKK